MPTRFYVYLCRACRRRNYFQDKLPPGPEFASCMYCHEDNSLEYKGYEDQD